MNCVTLDANAAFRCAAGGREWWPLFVTGSVTALLVLAVVCAIVWLVARPR